MKKLLLFTLLLIITVSVVALIKSKNQTQLNTMITQETSESLDEEAGVMKIRSPLEIEYMRKQKYSGSEITIEQTLPAGSNYQRYLTSYRSDNLKIYALLTIPNGDAPETGWPAIIFNHGYIPPEVYQTTERYVAYTDAFSRNGYVVFKPDYRGHGDSEGLPEGAYYSPAYTSDVLNAVSSIKAHPQVDKEKIGMWGHSMGGHITLRSMVITKDIKAGVIWAGVVASYKDMANNWHRSTPWQASEHERTFRRPNRQALIEEYGDFDENPEFWSSISPLAFVKDISGPIQLHHGTNDEEVPFEFSQTLNEELMAAQKSSELFLYEGDDHNLSQNLYTALDRSVQFFDLYLK